jgi:hypothetical protein
MTLQVLHDAFLKSLCDAGLSEALVETVKDKMVFGKVQVTYNVCLQQNPGLTDATKLKSSHGSKKPASRRWTETAAKRSPPSSISSKAASITACAKRDSEEEGVSAKSGNPRPGAYIFNFPLTMGRILQ